MSMTREERREYDRARKHAYGRDCLGCGKRTTGSNGRAKAPIYCIHCFNKREREKFWTEEAIIAAIHLYTHRYGRFPGAMDWSPPMARTNDRPDCAERFYSDGDYPHVNTVRIMFGSWNAAIASAGYEPRSIGKHSHSQS